MPHLVYHRRRLLWPSLVILAITAPLQGPATAGSPVRASRGELIGWILNSVSREPVRGARVVVEIAGRFPESGPGVGETDGRGRFVVRLPIGAIESRFDWGRVLTMSPFSLLLSPRALTKHSRIIDVTQANIQVRAPGFRTFTGRVAASRSDAAAFRLTLDDVWLSPIATNTVSFTPGRMQHEIVDGLSTDPPVALAGEQVRVRLSLRLPLSRGFRYRAFLSSSDHRVLPDDLELKRVKTDAPNGGPILQEAAAFERVVRLPPAARGWTELGFFISRDDGPRLSQKDTRVILPIVERPEWKPAAEKLVAAAQFRRMNQLDSALASALQAAKEQPGLTLAPQLCGDILVALGRAPEALVHYRRLVELDPDDTEVALPRLIQTLLDTNQGEAAARAAEKSRQILGSAPAPFELALAEARLAAFQGRFSEMDDWLLKAGEKREIPAGFLLDINLRRVRAMADAEPVSADRRLSLARVLDEGGRPEEALSERRRAAALDGKSPWVAVELAAGLWSQGRRDEASPLFERALQLSNGNLDCMLSAGSAYVALRNYHRGAELLSRVVAEQPQNLRATQLLAVARFMLGERTGARKLFTQLVNGSRSKGDLVESGIPFLFGALYFGPKRRFASGFSIPEAAAASVLLDALVVLDSNPEHPLALQNLGEALLILNEPSGAAQELERSLKADPSQVESRYLLALARSSLGDRAASRMELEQVLRANPRHPKARSEMARILLEQGDVGGAQEQLALHSLNYRLSTEPPQTPGAER